MKFKIVATHPTHSTQHNFIIFDESARQALDQFHLTYPHLKLDSIVEEAGVEDVESPLKCSKYKMRNHYKARLCQIRGNLQSMTDAEESLLTQEEILSLQRIACKVDRVISLFNTRTLDLKKGGFL